jgi:hypothetical protein
MPRAVVTSYSHRQHSPLDSDSKASPGWCTAEFIQKDIEMHRILATLGIMAGATVLYCQRKSDMPIPCSPSLLWLSHGLSGLRIHGSRKPSNQIRRIRLMSMTFVRLYNGNDLPLQAISAGSGQSVSKEKTVEICPRPAYDPHQRPPGWSGVKGSPHRSGGDSR